jgi:hypothetical protein
MTVFMRGVLPDSAKLVRWKRLGLESGYLLLHRLEDFCFAKARSQSLRDRLAKQPVCNLLESLPANGDCPRRDFHGAASTRLEDSFSFQFVIRASDDLRIGQQFLSIGAKFRQAGSWLEDSRRDMGA